MTAVNAVKSVSNNVSTYLQVPQISDLISFNESGNAPVLTFQSGITAKGVVGCEIVKEGTEVTSSTVHISYTLYTSDLKKCGSLYIELKYTGNAEGKYFNSATSQSITFTKTEAFEVATSYLGQSSEQDETEEDSFSDEVTYVIGSPATFHISLNDYYKIITGEALKWKKTPYDFATSSTSDNAFGLYSAIGHSAFIVINSSRSIINNNFEGFYLGMTDNMFVTPSDDYVFDAVDSVKITTKFYDSKTNDTKGLMDNGDDEGDFHTLNSNRLSFFLDSNYQGSISRVLTRNITSMDISSKEFDDTISMGLFKLSKNTNSSDILKLNYSLREKYNWSFGKTRLKSSSTATHPVSYFAENVTEGSNNITILMNPNIAAKSFVDTDGVIHGKMRIYGNKLLKNLDNFEKKYLLRDYISTNNNNGNTESQSVSAIVPARLANSSISSWKEMVSQAGITPALLKNFKTTYPTFQPLNSLMPFGTYTASTNDNKYIGELPYKISRALELVENDEEYPNIDIVLEAGLGTIYAYSTGSAPSAEDPTQTASLLIDEGGRTRNISNEEGKEFIFDDSSIISGIEDLRTSRSSISDAAQNFIEDYRDIQSVFLQFANSMQNGGRGDCFYISDVPRGILIKGKNTKVTDLYGSTIENNAYDFGDSVNHSFTTSVYYPIKHTFDTIVSSYMSTYAQWVKISDSISGEKFWLPVSGYIAGNMAATDGTYGPWYASAGLRRGVINGVLDYAISPNTTQRTDLYKICINSVPKIPNYGVTIWGIRTMSKTASAFDQNTCRRTFLYMEKKVKQTLRYYIFEPNTSYTRLQIVNDLDPFLEKVKNAGGIYSYTLVCDTTNNTPDVINNGDLAVSIAAAPTRTAENIVVEFTANKYTEEVSAAESIS